MRYYISAHGCYRKYEKVPLEDLVLDFYSAENEFLDYSDAYVQSFCSKSIHHKKAYKHVRRVKHHYYEMELGSEESDTFDSYVECCTTRERLYDFKHGDRLLSDILDLIRLHASQQEKPTKIYVSMLTCNDECNIRRKKEVGVVLRRSSSFSQTNYNARTKNLANVRKLSLLMRHHNMQSNPNSSRRMKHHLKRGNRVLDKKTGEKIRIQNKTQKSTFKRNPNYMFVPNVGLGDHVMYDKTMWQVIDEKKGQSTIQQLQTKDMVTVDTHDLMKIEF